MWMAIGAIASLFLIGIKIYVWYYKKKTKPSMEDDIQEMHEAIANGDADRISDLFDHMRRPQDTSHRVGQDDKGTP